MEKLITSSEPELSGYVHPIQVFGVLFRFFHAVRKLIRIQNRPHVIEVPISCIDSVSIGKPILRLYAAFVFVFLQDPEVVPHLSERPRAELTNVFPLEDDLLGCNVFRLSSSRYVAVYRLEELSRRLRQIVERVVEYAVGRERSVLFVNPLRLLLGFVDTDYETPVEILRIHIR